MTAKKPASAQSKHNAAANEKYKGLTLKEVLFLREIKMPDIVIWSDSFGLIPIRQHHVDGAVRCDQNGCVIARALYDVHGRDSLLLAFIGHRYSVLVFVGYMKVYRTPAKLKRGLMTFDETGQWNLPPGDYWLRPAKKRPSRHHARKKKTPGSLGLGGGVSGMMRGAAVATRYVTPINRIASHGCDVPKSKKKGKKPVKPSVN